MNWGPYRLVRVLHEGGEGTSVLAETDTERLVLKWVWREAPIHQPTLARLQKAATLNHHLLNVQRVINAGDAQVFVSRYQDGVSLQTALNDARCDSRVRLFIADQIIEGLAGLHEAGLVHGDLRVENVRVTRSGRVLLMDVEQLVLAESSRESSTKMVALNAITPEHLRAQGPTIVSDQFALASLFIELFTGKSALIEAGQLIQANVLDPVLPEPGAWQYLPIDHHERWFSILAKWWQSSEDRRPRALSELKSLVYLAADERVQLRTTLADVVNDLAPVAVATPIGCVVPQYPESERLATNGWAGLELKALMTMALMATLLAVLMLPGTHIAGDMSRNLLWVWLDDEARHTISEESRVYLEERWYKASAPRRSHGKRFSLVWSAKGVTLNPVRPRLMALVECGELFCFFRLKPVQGGRDSWHEQVPVRASLNRWDAVINRAIAFHRSQSEEG